MSQLEWKEVDFLDCFAVEPTVEEDAFSHNYELDRNGLQLLLTVWQMESVIQVSVFRPECDDAVFEFAAFVVLGVKLFGEGRSSAFLRLTGNELKAARRPAGSSPFEVSVPVLRFTVLDNSPVIELVAVFAVLREATHIADAIGLKFTILGGGWAKADKVFVRGALRVRVLDDFERFPLVIG